MKDRILEFLKAENKSSAVFAEEIGVQPSSISHILSGRNNPSLDFILKMLKRYPYLSTDWILFGKGTIYSDPDQQSLFNSAETAPSVNAENKQFEFINDSSAEISVPTDSDKPLQADFLAVKSGKKAVRIVYFYEDNTYREYFPDVHK